MSDGIPQTSSSAPRKGIYAYLALAFGLAWVAWEVPIRLGIAVTSPAFQLASLPGAFAPAIAALIVRQWITGEGFADAGLKVQRRGWPYFLIAWTLPLAVLAVIAIEATLLSIGTPDLSVLHALNAMGRAPSPGLQPYMGVLIVPQLLINALVATPVLWGEEFGWRGYLQPRLFPASPLLAALATGVIWAVWHAPLILRGYNYGAQPWLGMLLFPVTCVLLSIIFAWLRQRGGSIWASSLAHAATNVIGGGLSVLWFYGVAGQVWVGYQGVLAWLPLGALAAWIILTRQTNPR